MTSGRLTALLPLLVTLYTYAFPLLAHAQSDFVRIQVIDRGQADGILIRTPNHKWVVIDGGTNKDQAVGDNIAFGRVGPLATADLAEGTASAQSR